MEVSVIIPTYNRKQNVTRCLESVFASDYKNLEIIIVDNASTDGTAEFLTQKYGERIKLIRSEKNLMAGGGRNLGAQHAKGKYLLFIDDDNVIEKKMISELVCGIEKKTDAGMVGPLMYFFSDPKIFVMTWLDINLWTSKTNSRGFAEVDQGQYQEIFSVGHVPNAFMLRGDVWKAVGGIDKDYEMHYEESDLAEKIKKLGKKIYTIPTAKTYHDVPLIKNKKINSEEILRNHSLHSLSRAFVAGRNRILFMKKNATRLQYVVFCLFFLPAFSVYYLYLILRFGKLEIAKSYCQGVWAGLVWKK